MNWNQTVEEFQIRYYYWAFEDFKREIKNDFPFLRAFNSGPAWAAMSIISSLEFDDRILFAKALTKRFHPQAVELLEESMTETEKEICKEFRDKILTNSPRELAHIEKSVRKTSHEYVSRSKLRRFIKHELTGLNMKEGDDELGAILRYETRINSWDILTDIDISGTHSRLIYHHTILAAERPQIVRLKSGQEKSIFIPLAKSISLNSWFGISSQTEWAYLSEIEAKQATKCLADLCSHFIKNAKMLLKGLAPG
jgi:hypothetical protein